MRMTGSSMYIRKFFADEMYFFKAQAVLIRWCMNKIV